MSDGVPVLGWVVSLLALVALLAVDLLVVSRRKSALTPKVAGRWIGLYVALAGVAALLMLVTLGREPAEQFVATYVTEYSLSADNLFVFMLIIGRFAVPELAIEPVLTVGILLSLVLRVAFIAAGSAAVSAFSWLFYVFGAFLVYTAVRLLRLAAGIRRRGGEAARHRTAVPADTRHRPLRRAAIYDDPGRRAGCSPRCRW